MATLAAWRFATTDGAVQASVILERLRPEGSVIHDSAVVEWDSGKRRPRTRRPTPTTRTTETAAPGAIGADFWTVLFGLIFSLPLLGAAVGAATGAAAGSLADVGVDDHFINRVRDLVTPGTSALFVLGPDAAVDRVRDALAAAPPSELVTTHLDANQEAALREVFGT